MPDRHHRYWPPGLSKHLTLPQTNLFHNVEVSAARFPDKPFIIFYDTPITFAEFMDQAERIAGFLQHECHVKPGDRVLLYLQNSPQWVLAYYGILRANAVVVPVNPMNLTEELRHYVHDTAATTAFVSQDLYPQIQPLVGSGEGLGLQHLIVVAYSDYLKRTTDLRVPEFVGASRQPITGAEATLWSDMLARNLRPGTLTAGSDDLSVMPYTSGTTGLPKGCMHTHRSVMSTLLGGGVHWFSFTQDSVYLSVLPFFHVTGMSGSMNGPLYVGATIILLSRWDRDVAAQCIQRYRVTVWHSISTMMIDFLSNPRLPEYDLSSLQTVRGGGAAMPEVIARRLQELTGREYVEGYGLSETMATTHLNPPQRPKRQCLGIPVFDVDSRVIDPDTLQELPANEIGEIVIHGPQVMRGYWNQPEATRDTFVEIDGKRFLRTGDLGRMDDEGYFFMVDRLKRVINTAGFKVWPAEVEAMMHNHPAIHEACVIAARDERRGETVKALVVLKEDSQGKVSEQDVIDWARAHMAAYKSPRIVEFVTMLPKSASGKVQWRDLQKQEAARSAG
jgi:fatty-acyl-CoA synthase